MCLFGEPLFTRRKVSGFKFTKGSRMTDYKNLAEACGMSLKGAGRLLGTTHDISRQWACGRTTAPIEAIETLSEICASIKEITDRRLK